MDEPRTFECPSCGGELTTDGRSPTIECPYCGQNVTVPRDLRVEPSAPVAAAPAAESPLVPLIRLAEEEAEAERAERAKQRAQPAPRRRGGGCGCGSIVFAVVIILVILIGGAIFTGNGPVLLQALDAASGATPTPKPVSHPLNAALPRSLRYAGVTLTVNKADMTNEDPQASDGSRFRSDSLFAVLAVKLDNTVGEREVALPYGVPRLELADGNQYEEDGSLNFDVAGAASKQGRMIFRVPPASNWQGAKLVVREAGKEPAVLPLDGAPPHAVGPVDLKLATEKNAGALAYRVLSATLDTAHDGRQVDAGKRFLRFNIRVVNNGKEAGGVTVTDSNFRLLLDGDSLAPDDYPIVAVPPQSKVDGHVDFTVPADAKTATLQVGELNGPKAQIPVRLAQ